MVFFLEIANNSMTVSAPIKNNMLHQDKISLLCKISDMTIKTAKSTACLKEMITCLNKISSFTNLFLTILPSIEIVPTKDKNKVE